METSTEEKTKASIPESITLGGVTYVVKETPELQQFIQSVAKVEKSKLYSQFEGLKAQIQQLASARIENSAVDVDALVAKLSERFVAKEDLESTLQKIVQPAIKSIEQTRQEELEQYRQQLLTQHAGECIPELVKGNSREELDASMKESIRLRTQYPAPNPVTGAHGGKVTDPLIEAQMKALQETAPSPTAAQPAQPAQPIPAVPLRPSMEVGTGQNIKKMSMDEFAKNRENLYKQIEAVIGE